MTQPKNSAIGIQFIILSCVIFICAVALGSFFHSYLHVELHPLDDNHLVVGSATTLIIFLLITTLFLRNRTLAKEVEAKGFELKDIYQDNTIFHILSEKSGDMVHLNDTRGTILYANPVTFNLLGYEVDEIINKPARQFIHPDDREKIQNDMKHVTQGNDIPPREIRLLKKSGDFLDVEVKGFYLNTNSEDVYIGAILRDITNRKQNKALLQVREDWEKTFNSMSEFVSVHDKDFKVIKANSALCKFLGKSAGEIVGKPCYQVFHNLNKPLDKCPHQKTTKTQFPTSTIIKDTNLNVPLKITCSPMFDQEGVFQGSVHIARIFEDNKPSVDNERDIITICAACKFIKNEKERWIQPEEFFMNQYDSQFTHSICKGCQEKLYPEYFKL